MGNGVAIPVIPVDHELRFATTNFYKYKIIERLESLDMFDSQALMEIDNNITPIWKGNNKNNKTMDFVIYRHGDSSTTLASPRKNGSRTNFAGSHMNNKIRLVKGVIQFEKVENF
jgi:hypothetical protein